jgi:glycosyltransferase involved in cell wall biosynthesis
MAADCTVITVDYEYSAGSEIVGEGGFTVKPTTGAVAAVLERALSGERPATPPTERAASYDWDVVTDRTERYYRSIVGTVE